MDGISVAASFVSMAAKITLGLNDFITWIKEAPKLATAVLQEVADISACVGQVQSLLLGVGSVNASNQSLLMIEEVNVVLTNCVLTLSELEKLVEGLKLDQRTSISYLRRWAIIEKAVAALLSRLQYSKTSLSLMISTMTHQSMENAQRSMSRLTDVVRQLLERNREISERLGCMELETSDCRSTIVRTTRKSISEELIEDYESIVTVRQLNASPSEGKANGLEASRSSAEFESLLESSRPYVRASRRPGPSSATSSVVQTLGWSCLSGLSLAEVSNISIMELALDKNRVWNSTRYDTAPRYLGTVAEGKRLKAWSLEALPKMMFGCCKECGEVSQHLHIYLIPSLSNFCNDKNQDFHQQDIAYHSCDTFDHCGSQIVTTC